MFLLNGTYTRPLAEVEPHARAHAEWVAKGLERGLILFAGRKKSGLGGVLVIRSVDKAELLEFIADDVYVREDVTEYQIVDFDCSIVQPTISGLANA
jgi:uncharacterized protein YciI